MHFHFGKKVFEAEGLLNELEETLYKTITPHIIGDAKGVANEKTETGLKLILTENDASIAGLIKENLKPLFGRLK